MYSKACSTSQPLGNAEKTESSSNGDIGYINLIKSFYVVELQFLNFVLYLPREMYWVTVMKWKRRYKFFLLKVWKEGLYQEQY